MSATLFQIENLVGVIKLRQQGVRGGALAAFDKFDDETLAKMLATLAVQHLASVTEAADA